MRAQDVIRIARDRAGLTQQQLAARTGRSRETILRWEAGNQTPSLEAVSALVKACELDLVLRLTKSDTSLADLVQEQRALPPLKRLTRLLPTGDARAIVLALHWVAGSRTPVILVGQVAAALLGAPQRPDESRVEIVSSDPVAIERELSAHGYQPADTPERWRESDTRELWMGPKDGALVLARDIPGTRDFRDLRRAASPLRLDGRREVVVAHPRDLLRIADASPRESERARAPGLQALLESTES